MNTTVVNIWCNGNAREMAEFYTATLRNSQVTGTVSYPSEGLPEFQADMAGKDLTIDIDIDGRQLTLINADDTFRPNPAFNFMLNFDPAQFSDAHEYLTQTWDALAEGGTVRMELGSYGFSELYGWVEDRYGVNWQLILTNPDNEPRPHLIPSLLFAGDHDGQCAEAVDYYCSIIEGSKVGTRVPYPDNPHSVMFSEFQLAGQWFCAADGGPSHDFTFTGGVSLLVTAHGQADIDRLWSALAATEQPCGWCVDKFGLAWQVIPENFGQLMSRPKAYENMMTMTKIIIDAF